MSDEYRMLVDGEQIQAGDEYCDERFGWCVISDSWVFRCKFGATFQPMRRKLTHFMPMPTMISSEGDVSPRDRTDASGSSQTQQADVCKQKDK